MRDAARVGERVAVTALGSCVGRRVRVSGYVQTVRVHSSTQIIVVRDETGSVQVTNARGVRQAVDEQIDQLTVGSAVEFSGLVVAAPLIRLGGLEIVPDSVEFASVAAQPLPLNAHSAIDSRLDWRFLDLRGSRQHLTFQVASALEHAMRSFLHARSFINIHTPKVVAAPERGSQDDTPVLAVDYFGANGALSRTPQYFKQMAMAAGYPRVFEVGPVYRAERSFMTNRASEFTEFDLEMAWIDSVEEVIHLSEQMLAYAIREVHDLLGRQIQDAFEVDVVVPSVPFPRMTYREAEETLRLDRWQVNRRKGSDFDPEEEQRMSEMALARAGSAFLYITDYPASLRPFYELRDARDESVAKGFELLSLGQRIASGGQHEHRYDALVAQAAERRMPLAGMASYIDCFQYGCPTHGGLSLGINRLLMTVLHIRSIRETTMFPRGPNRISP